MQDIYNFFAMLSRMRYINRWGLMRNTIKENIAEHSLDTAMIAYGLAVIGNTYFGKELDAEHIAVIGMFHDAAEIITGDMPTPIKYFAPEIQKAYKNVEKYAGHQLVSTLPKEMQQTYEEVLLAEEREKENYRYVKAADKLSALIKCEEELGMGNGDFSKARLSTERAVRELHMEEADYFIEHFLPSYRLTIDEQT